MKTFRLLFALAVLTLPPGAALAAPGGFPDTPPVDPLIQDGANVGTGKGGEEVADFNVKKADGSPYHVVKFETVATTKAFDATKTFVWMGRTLTNCVSSKGAKLGANSATPNRWTCDVVRVDRKW
jgi:hypothetical protein